eukprot:TRINITY_DN4816_c0_g1_i1.p1 TRINITY_DN4816_c0_g1~~TRINITY_DN4816_c0_g1_i1.p1  ORF type:complete len:674 (-),score=194.83 TRINITY_DN4816_c0_g1_i1:731-2578(-)
MKTTKLSPGLSRTQSPMSNGGNGNSPQRKITFKGFKVRPALPEKFEEQTAVKLLNAVTAIHECRPVQDSFQDLYKGVEEMCIHKFAPSLHAKLKNLCEQHALALGEQLSKQIQTNSAQEALSCVNSVWEDYCKQMRLVRQIFLYLDRTFVLQTAGLLSLWDLGLRLFRDRVVCADQIYARLLSCLLAVILNDRSGEAVDRSLIASATRMLHDVAVYESHFEPAFRQATHDFYREAGKEYFQSLDVADYLKYCEDKLADEGERVLHYLFPSTRKPLLAAVQQELLEAHIAAIVAKGFESLMDHDRLQDLDRMFRLFAAVNATKELKQAFAVYIKNAGRQIVSDTKRDDSMIADLLALKARIDVVIERAFARNVQFVDTVKESFEVVINERPNKPAEMLAKYVDMHLRSGTKGGSEEEFEQLLDRVLTLFRYSQEKDVFKAFHKTHLSRRLLLGKSSLDMEKAVVSRLKSECGTSFTSELEGMFKDIDLSKDIMEAYKADTQQKHNLGPALMGVDLTVFVLTQSFWPHAIALDVRLPTEIAELQQHFKTFYLNKYSGRKLQFNCAMGSCVLKAHFLKARKELSVSHFQASILMLFNTSDQLGFKEISELTGLGTHAR